MELKANLKAVHHIVSSMAEGVGYCPPCGAPRGSIHDTIKVHAETKRGLPGSICTALPTLHSPLYSSPGEPSGAANADDVGDEAPAGAVPAASPAPAVETGLVSRGLVAALAPPRAAGVGDGGGDDCDSPAGCSVAAHLYSPGPCGRPSLHNPSYEGHCEQALEPISEHDLQGTLRVNAAFRQGRGGRGDSASVSAWCQYTC